MLIIYRMFPKIGRSTLTACLSTAKRAVAYEVIDVKNSHLVYVRDPQGRLAYMDEVVTQSGEKGTVIKIEQNGTSVIGMYRNISRMREINLAGADSQQLANLQPSYNNVYDINLKPIATINDAQHNRFLSSSLQQQGKRTRIKTLSPLLAANHDMFVGDFINLSGPLGSGRTTNAFLTMQCFTNSSITQACGVYLNTNMNDFRQTCAYGASQYRTFSIGRSLAQNRSDMSSFGVYALAVKTIKLAKRLKSEGKNVFLVVDNINEILSNEWTVLQNLKLPISPFSILNQLYSSCSDNQLSKNSNKAGSLTAMVISTPENQDVIQEYTTFGNNTKYLRTLAPEIGFPLQLSVNHNAIRSQQVLAQARANINRLAKQKKDKQLLAKLKLTRDEPWEHYFLLDSDWWVPALKKYQPVSLSDRDLFLWFINTNIEEDYCAHWRIDCTKAYNKYLDFLARPEDLSIGRDLQQLESFIELCKNDDSFDVFKKDYL